jgi:hypothetical protein
MGEAGEDWFKPRTHSAATSSMGSNPAQPARPRSKTMVAESQREEPLTKRGRAGQKAEDDEEDEEEEVEEDEPMQRRNKSNLNIQRALTTRALTEAIINIEKLTLQNTQQLRQIGPSGAFDFVVLTMDSGGLVKSIEESWQQSVKAKTAWEEGGRVGPPPVQLIFKTRGVMDFLDGEMATLFQNNQFMEEEENKTFKIQWQHAQQLYIDKKKQAELHWLLKLCNYKLTREGRQKKGPLKGQCKVYISAYPRTSIVSLQDNQQIVVEFPILLFKALVLAGHDVRHGSIGPQGLEQVNQTSLQEHLKCTKQKGKK